MKILTIAATPFFSDRGCHIRIYNEAKHLQGLGNEIKIVTYDKGRNVDGLNIKRISRTFFYHKTSPGFSWLKIWADLKLLILVLREIGKFNPDIIHAHLYEGLAIGHLARFLLRKKIPIVVDLQGNLEREFESYNKNNKLAKLVFTRLAKKVISWADWVVISSQNSKEHIEQVYDKEKISVIEDGIDLELFNLKHPDEDVCAEIDKIKKWKENESILIYAGGMEDSKGVGDLIREFENIPKGWKLLLFGKGKQRKDYENFVKKRSLGNKIYFAEKSGYFDLPFYLSAGDAGIDPKNGSTEGSGKLINYLAAGLPILCFETKNSRHLLGEEGIYLSKISDLEFGLEKIKSGEMKERDLEVFSAETEAKKLESTFHNIL